MNPSFRSARPASRLTLLLSVLAASACSKEGPASSVAAAPSASASAGPHFTDALAGSGIDFRHHFIDTESGSTYKVNPYDHGSGVLVADVNGDGLEDVYFLDFLGPNQLYLNKGGLHFENASAKSGIQVDRAISVGGAFGDYDRDGDPDLYVTTYRGGNHLFRNKGDGTFEDVTDAAGVAYKGHSSSATWFDYDADGDLDLYLANIGKFTTDTISREAEYLYEGVSLPFPKLAAKPEARVEGEPDFLWRNDGNGKFTDVTAAAGISGGEWNGDATVADYDLDGDLDLYVSNMFGINHLNKNNGDGTFTDVATSVLARTSWGGMGCKFFDGNGDELPDLLVTDMHSDMWLPPNAVDQVKATVKYDTPLGTSVEFGKAIQAASDTRAPAVLFGNTYFENQGGGAFAEKSAAAGLETWWPWGVAAGDYDNDGWEDVFMPAGMGFPFYYWPASLMRNVGGKFTDVATAAGIEPPPGGRTIAGAEVEGKPFPRSARAAAAADFDQDGDLDLVVANFNAPAHLLRNDSPPASWLAVDLRGKKANREGYGARVRVTAGGRTTTRQLGNSEGYLAQASRLLHFGLGSAKKVERVEVFWPGAKTPQTIDAPPIDHVLRVEQE